MTTRTRLLSALSMVVLGFLLVARWAVSGDSMHFDTGLRNAIHGWASLPLTRAMVAVTTLGSELFLVPIGAILAWQLAASGRKHQALLLALVSLSAELVSQLLKLLFQRPRPEVFFGLSTAETYSFPSGHAFVATVFYGLLASIFIASEPSQRKRRVIAAVTLSVSLLIGFSRVYLGYHYPSDVLGGWACAVAWLALAQLTLSRTKEHAAGEPEEEHQ